MVKAAFLAAEHLEGLVLRPDRRETLLRERERDLLVTAAMHQQERARHLLHDTVEAKAFELLERRGAIGRAEHPHQMFRRNREREHLAGIERFQSALPDIVIIPLRAPGDAAGKALIERGGTWRIVPAETERDDADPA